MSIMDVFRQDPFTAIQLTSFVEKTPFLPVGIGELNLFDPLPIRTTALAVEERAGQLVVIPTSARGAPPAERTTEKRKMRYFEVPRLAHGDTIYAHELQGIREFGSETVMMQLQTEVARRLAGPTGLQSNLEYTKERHRLGAIVGVVKDADNSTLFDWFAEFGITAAADVDFTFGTTTTKLRPLCAGIVRTMARNSQGAWRPGTRVGAICGDTFFDKLVTHGDVEKTFMNWSEASELRKGTAFKAFPFAEIDWFNYRGSDNLTDIGIATDECRFFPIGAPGVFQVAQAPGESFEWVNTPGKPEYVVPIIDRDRNAWWRQELYSYPLHICTRPAMLRRGFTSN